MRDLPQGLSAMGDVELWTGVHSQVGSNADGCEHPCLIVQRGQDCLPMSAIPLPGENKADLQPRERVSGTDH